MDSSQVSERLDNKILFKNAKLEVHVHVLLFVKSYMYNTFTLDRERYVSDTRL